MTGLIWYVQVVHYPSFAKVSREYFSEFLAFHTKRTDWIVIPVMSIELASSGALLWFAKPVFSLDSLGFILVLSIWLSTFFFSVPIHYKLEEKGNELELVSRLVQTNWIRTSLWSTKTLLSIYLLY